MAKVTNYPNTTIAGGIEKQGARITKRRGQNTLAPRISVWQDCPQMWSDCDQLWTWLPYADWQDCPDLWSDCATYWDILVNADTTAMIRHQFPRAGRVFGAYKSGAENLRRASAAWKSLDTTTRAIWINSAEELNTASLIPVIDPRTHRARFGTHRQLTGFNLFMAAIKSSYPIIPPPPNDATYTELNEMTELLVGDDYEGRIIQTLQATAGDLSIAMYQVSPNWSGIGVAASPLWARLIDEPQRRTNCRIIIGTPPATSTLRALNDAAASALAAVGWQVHRHAEYPVLHAKLWIIERGYLYAGSHNLSNRATTANREAGILTTSPASIIRARTWFAALWASTT